MLRSTNPSAVDALVAFVLLGLRALVGSVSSHCHTWFVALRADESTGEPDPIRSMRAWRFGQPAAQSTSVNEMSLKLVLLAPVRAMLFDCVLV